MVRKLFVMEQCDIQSFNSEEYGEIFSCEIPEIGGDTTQKYVQFAQKVVEYMIECEIKELLIVADNTKYNFLVLGVVMAAKQLNYLDNFRIYILPEFYLVRCKKESIFVESVYMEIDWRKPRLEQYQVHLTDKCNLNCKGCGHFCCITPQDNFIDVEEYVRDMRQLKKKFWGVERLYLLGGEPLLHPEVSVIMEKTRMIFPDADIRLTTNGLLLPKQSEEFYETVKRYNIHLEISLYQPTQKLLSEGLEELLKSRGGGMGYNNYSGSAGLLF